MKTGKLRATSNIARVRHPKQYTKDRTDVGHLPFRRATAKLIAVRVSAFAVLSLSVLVFRFGSHNLQETLPYASVTFAAVLFAFLGLYALRARTVSHHALSFYALAAGRFEELIGLALTPIGALVIWFGILDHNSTAQDWSPLGGVVLFVAGYFVWRGAYAVWIVDNSQLHYVSLFGGHRTVCLDEIHRIRNIVAIHPTRPTQRIEIYPVQEQDNPIVMNRAIFKKADIQHVLMWLGDKTHMSRSEEIRVQTK